MVEGAPPPILGADAPSEGVSRFSSRLPPSGGRSHRAEPERLMRWGAEADFSGGNSWSFVHSSIPLPAFGSRIYVSILTDPCRTHSP